MKSDRQREREKRERVKGRNYQIRYNDATHYRKTTVSTLAKVTYLPTGELQRLQLLNWLENEKRIINLFFFFVYVFVSFLRLLTT